MTFVNDNNEVLETNDEVAITKQAVSFFGFKIKGDYSVNFKVPNNSVTRDVLNYEGPQMVNQVAFTRQVFTLMRDGNPFLRGSIVIQDDDNGELDCYFISGNSNWVNLLQGLITEITYTTAGDGQPYDMFWSYFDGITYPEGIVMPLIDVIGGRGGNRIYAGQNYPCMYLWALLREIFQSQGLKVTGNIFNEANFKSLVITPEHGSLFRKNYGDYYAYGNNQAISNTFSVYNTWRSKSDSSGLINLSSTYFFTNDQNCSVAIYVIVTCVEPTTIRYEDSTGSTFDTVINGNTDIWGSDHKLIVANTDVVYQLGGAGTSTYIAKGTTVRLQVKANTATTPNFRFDSVRFEIPREIPTSDIVNPATFLPKIKCIDIVKYVISSFGCCAYFNTESKTVTINIIENIKTESAPDWSEYHLSHRSEYTVSQGQNNYYRNADSDESFLTAYNKQNTLGFGEANITTQNRLTVDYLLYQSPFAATITMKGKSSYWLPFIQYQTFEDDGDACLFTSIVSVGGIARFTAAAGSFATLTTGPVRIVSGGIDLGIFSCDQVTSTYFTCQYLYFNVTNTGSVYRQKITKNAVKPRILSVKKTIGISDCSDLPAIAGYTYVDYSWYTLPTTGYAIDSYIGAAAYQNPNLSGYIKPCLKDIYLRKISQILNNPSIRMQMLLPEATFQAFEFGSFIYVKAEDLDGYFFVDSIVNYKDGNTPVEVNLYML